MNKFNALCSLVACVGALAACGDDAPSADTGGRLCVPGQTQSCTCTDGAQGAQTCDDQGARFLECVCDPNNTPNNDPNNDPNNAPNNDPNNEPDAPNNDPNNEPDAPNNDPGQGCLDGIFMDLSNVEGAGPDYPAPTLSVTCTEDTIVVESNSIPHYEYINVTPNGLQAQNNRWEIAHNPLLLDEMTDIPLLGVAAFAINGVPIFGPNEGPVPDPFGDPIYNDIMDWCLGHSGPGGSYHYHAFLTECFFPDYQEGDPSPILGFSLDGFPIYGPWGCVDEACTEVVKFESSWVRTGDPTTYAWDNHACDRPECAQAQGTQLDRCNGRVGPDGTYRYHATDGFPYIMGCYHGDPGDAGGGDPNNDPNNMPGPVACQDVSDCDGACPEGSVGCTCANSPMGQICVPTCNVDADCPTGMMPLRCDPGMGICVPNR